MNVAGWRYVEGYEDFGDAMFWATEERQNQEIVEEFADAIDWTIGKLERRRRESKG